MVENPEGPLLVPVANPETVDRLMNTAVDIARDRSIDIIALHVVEVPPQVPLSQGDHVVSADVEGLIEYVNERADEVDVDIETRMRYARDTATGIIGAVDEYGVGSMLMGWRGRPRRRDIVLGSFLDRVIGSAPCDVYVKRIKQPTGDIESILVPIGGGPHDECATELAGSIARQHDATIRLLHVDTGRHDAPDRLLEERREVIPDSVSTETAVIESDDPSSAIVEVAESFDLTVLGATQESVLRRRLVGSIAQEVGRSVPHAAIVTRRYTE